MKFAPNIRVKNRLWNIFPFSKYTAQAIYPNIYFQKNVYENLLSDKPRPTYVASLIHEQTHIERQRKLGFLIWALKYLMFPKFRFNEELQAIKASMKFLKDKKLSFDVTGAAKYLSGWLYLGCVHFERAKNELDKVWRET